MRPPGGRPTGLLLLALAAGCADDPPSPGAGRGERPAAEARRVVDADGDTLTLEEAPERIVSLVPSATETLRALGAGSRLVGRTDFDTARVLADLPTVGGGLRPSVEVLLSLTPDLVVRFAGESDPETPNLLDDAGIPHLAVRPERIDDVQRMIRALGVVTGREASADSILARQDRVLGTIRTLTRDLPPVRVAFTLGGDPPFVAGPATFVGELLELAGGRNVFDDLERPWAGVSPETVVDRAPALLLTMEGSRLDPRLTRGREVRHVPSFVQLPGPDLDRAAMAIARALHPDAIPATAGGAPR